MNQYKEQQYFDKKIKTIFTIVMLVIIVFVGITLLLNLDSSQDKIAKLVITFAVSTLALIIFWFTSLKFSITQDAIYYKFIPFHIRRKKIPKSDIKSILLRNSTWIDSTNLGKKIRVFDNSANYIMNKNYQVLEIVLKNGSTKRLSIKNDKSVKQFLKDNYKVVSNEY